MKKVSLFWCLGNLEAISFFSLFLTFTVQPPSVSRQRCHMNIRSGRCYLMKEGRTGEEGVGVGGGKWGEEKRGSWGGGVAVVIKARYYKQREKGSRQLTAQLRWRRQSEARYECLIGSEKKKRKGTKKTLKPKQKLPKWRESDSRSRDSLPSFHHDTPAAASGSHLISFTFTCHNPHPQLPAATAVCCLKQSGKSKRKSSAAPSGRGKIRFFLGDNICSIIHILEEVWWESDPKWKKWAQHKETQTTFSNWWKK